MVSQGTAPKIPQTEEGATYDKMIKKDVVQVSIKSSNPWQDSIEWN